jgi:hypothetical protein
MSTNLNGWKIVAAAHHNGYTAFIARRADGMVTGWSAGSDRADEDAEKAGQRIERHDDGSCTIHDLPKPKTALELIEELRTRLHATIHPRLDAIAEAIREGRAM